MFEKFIEYMNSDAASITKIDADGEEVFHFSMSNWFAWSLVILLVIIALV